MQNLEFSSRRIAKNTLLLYIRSFASMLIGIYTSRILLDALGVEDFGIYNLVGSIVILFSFLNGAMLVSVQRFMNYEMGRRNFDQLNKVFCMSINIQLLLAVVFGLVCEIAGVYLLNHYLNIAAERTYAAFWVLQFSIMATMCGILSIPYNGLLIANEDMRSFAYIEILGACLKLVIVLIICHTRYDRLILYASGIMFVQLFLRFLYYSVCRIKFNAYRYSFIWDKKLFREMFSFSSWTMLSGISFSVKYQSINLFYNIFYGVFVNAALGIAAQIYTAINSLIANFTVSFNPQIVKNYAGGDWEKVRLLHFTAPKITFFLTSVFSLPILLNTDYILQIWLKDVPLYTEMFIRLALADILLISLMPTANTVIRASGHIKRFEISNFIIICSFICLAYLCGRFNIRSIYLMLIFSTTTVNLYATYKSCREIGIKYKQFLTSVHGYMIFSFAIALSVALFIQIENRNIGCFLINILAAVLCVVSAEFLLGLNKIERNFLCKKIQDRLQVKLL